MAVMTALAIGAGVSAIGGAVAANQADKAARHPDNDFRPKGKDTCEKTNKTR